MIGYNWKCIEISFIFRLFNNHLMFTSKDWAEAELSFNRMKWQSYEKLFVIFFREFQNFSQSGCGCALCMNNDMYCIIKNYPFIYSIFKAIFYKCLKTKNKKKHWKKKFPKWGESSFTNDRLSINWNNFEFVFVAISKHELKLRFLTHVKNFDEKSPKNENWTQFSA